MYEISVTVPSSANGEAVSISGASAQSAVYGDATTGAVRPVVITPTVDCFVVQGLNPTALATGVHLYLRGLQSYRVYVSPGYRLAFITSGGAGTVYISPDA